MFSMLFCLLAAFIIKNIMCEHLLAQCLAAAVMRRHQEAHSGHLGLPEPVLLWAHDRTKPINAAVAEGATADRAVDNCT